MRGGAGPCLPPSPSPPGDLRRQSPICRSAPPGPSPGDLTLPWLRAPGHTFSQLRFLLTPRPLPALSAQNLSLSTISPSRAACNKSCGEYFGDQAWVRAEGHLALAKAPAPSLSQTSAPHWRSSAVPTARHTSSPAKTPLSAQVSGQPAILACSLPTSTSKSIVVSVWTVFLVYTDTPPCSPSSLGKVAPPKMSGFHVSSFRATCI